MLSRKAYYSLSLGLWLVTSELWANDSLDDLNAINDTSAAAVTANSDETASSLANSGFNAATETNPPPVYLDCNPCVIDPAALNQYDPPEPSLKPSYVPPLPENP